MILKNYNWHKHYNGKIYFWHIYHKYCIEMVSLQVGAIIWLLAITYYFKIYCKFWLLLSAGKPVIVTSHIWHLSSVCLQMSSKLFFLIKMLLHMSISKATLCKMTMKVLLLLNSVWLCMAILQCMYSNEYYVWDFHIPSNLYIVCGAYI